jgi:hypothetical protein
MINTQQVRASTASAASVELREVQTEFDSHADTCVVGDAIA